MMMWLPYFFHVGQLGFSHISENLHAPIIQVVSMIEHMVQYA
jgi:hypothetical protein